MQFCIWPAHCLSPCVSKGNSFSRLHIPKDFFSHDDVDMTAKLKHNNLAYKTAASRSKPEPREAALVEHLVHTRCVSVSTTMDPQARRCESSRRSTREQTTPTQAPTLLSSALQHCWLRPCSCLCQVPYERHCFERPPAPTSKASTTNLAGCPRWTSSGASSSATPSLSAAPRLAVPSQWRAETRVVSTANWAPPCNGSPSTTTSKRRASFTATGRSRSRTNKLVATLPPASRHTRAAALSTTNPRLDSLRTRCTMMAKRVKNGGNGRRKRRSRSTQKSWESQKPSPLLDHSANEATPFRVQRPWASNPVPGTATPLELLPHAATLHGECPTRSLQCCALVVGLQPPTPAMTAPRNLLNWRVALPPLLPCEDDESQMDLPTPGRTSGNSWVALRGHL